MHRLFRRCHPLARISPRPFILTHGHGPDPFFIQQILQADLVKKTENLATEIVPQVMGKTLATVMASATPISPGNRFSA
jgi:hypothetical protein